MSSEEKHTAVQTRNAPASSSLAGGFSLSLVLQTMQTFAMQAAGIDPDQITYVRTQEDEHEHIIPLG